MTQEQLDHVRDMACHGLLSAAAKAYAASNYGDERCLEEAIRAATVHLEVLRGTQGWDWTEPPGPF